MTICFLKPLAICGLLRRPGTLKVRRTWHLWNRWPASASSSPAPPEWSADRSPRRSPPTTPCSGGRGSAIRRPGRSSRRGGARVSNPKAREELEAAGATAVRVDLGAADFDEVPDDLDYVLNFAVARSN